MFSKSFIALITASNLPPWAHLLDILAIDVIAAFVLAYTKPSNVRIRLAVAAVLLLLAVHHFFAMKTSFIRGDQPTEGALSNGIVCHALILIDLFLLTKTDYEEVRQTLVENSYIDGNAYASANPKHGGKGPSMRERLSVVYSVCWNSRMIATKWWVKGTPRFSKIPTRTEFLLQQTRPMALAAIVAYFIIKQQQQTAPYPNMEAFTEEKQYFFSRLGDVTRDEIRARLVLATTFWFLTGISMRTIHAILASIFVGLGIHKPQHWPSLLGSVTDLWSLRQFWG